MNPERMLLAVLAMKTYILRNQLFTSEKGSLGFEEK